VGRGHPGVAQHPARAAGDGPFNGGEISPGPSVETDEQILDWVRKDGETALHPSCTCRMGAEDDDSVVDPLTMKVWGVEGVRVCDASAMRYVTNGNIYAPVMMMAEKAADLILGNTPLPPEHTEFYRGGRHVRASSQYTPRRRAEPAGATALVEACTLRRMTLELDPRYARLTVSLARDHQRVVHVRRR
jgi:choline dehydrogenase-like flavoprotein